MASENQMNQLLNVVNAILSIDKNKLLRASLGEEALEKDFTPTLAKIRAKVEFALQYADKLHDSQIQHLISQFEAIRTTMAQQTDRSNAEYVTNRAGFLQGIKSHLEELNRFWPPLITAAVEARGLLKDEGIRQEYERTIESIKKESESALQQVQGEAQKTIEVARTLAKQIEDRARRTAAGISVKEAQEQFREAQTALDKRVMIWAGLGIASVLVFFFTVLYFARIELPTEWRWQVVYYSVIKVSLLTAIGTIAAFCLKILRAHLHMSEKNRHRQRVANSMEAFVASAVTPEQRDLILSQLVDSVVQFGNSGLIQREDDHVYRPKMTIDSINRNLSTNPHKDV